MSFKISINFNVSQLNSFRSTFVSGLIINGYEEWVIFNEIYFQCLPPLIRAKTPVLKFRLAGHTNPPLRTSWLPSLYVFPFPNLFLSALTILALFQQNSIVLIVVGNLKYSEFMKCYKEIWLYCKSAIWTLISPDEHRGGLSGSMRTLPAGLGNRPVL